MYKVLITTSGIGSRLGDLTSYTNKCLVRAGNKPAISYILENYDEDVEFVITLGYYGNHVKDFLKLAYPNKKFTFVEIDNYNEIGSSLGYSLLKAKDHLQCPFIFHASDTIVLEKIPNPTLNWLGYSYKDNFSQYRTIELNSALKIYEKGDLSSSAIYIGLAGINDYNSFWINLEKEYLKNPNNSNLSDCHAINNFLNADWKTFEFKTWLDIGNVSALKETRKKIENTFDVLDKNDESIFIFNNFVIKFFHDETICNNRIKRGINLGNLVPKMLGYTSNFYKYEYSDGDLFSSVVNEKSFEKFLMWSLNNLWIQRENDENFKNVCNNFYFKKTKERINKFLLKYNINDKTETINGYEIPPVLEMLDSIDINKLCISSPYQFHGDYILDNVIAEKNGNFKLIDWRQDFGGDIYNGDIYYDLSKLNHNLVFNHEIVNNNNFFVKIEKNEIICDILRSDNLCNCKQILHNFIKKFNFDLKKVNLLTSIIWLNMSPLHESKIGHFLYYFGKLNLYKTLNE